MDSQQRHALLQPKRLLRYMPRVQQQRQELRLIEVAWDNLSLLASLSTLSSKSSSGGDLAQARHDFAALSEEMMRGLASEALKTVLDDLGSRAQVCIDIMVRNLFERTADIGFFATDVVVADYLAEPAAAQRPGMEQHLREYADKYTVYDNIFLFDTLARLQACLNPLPLHGAPSVPADEAFLADVAASQAAYTEHYGLHGFCSTSQPSLVYAQPVRQGPGTTGVLCLQFKLADEAGAIFAQVLGDAEHDQNIVLALVDLQGVVIHSSDVLQLPLGWRLPQASAAGTFTLRHLSRQYLTVVRDTLGFQGYAGPGWRGLAMLPLEGAFEQDEDENSSELVDEVARNPHFLSGELSAIPLRSAAIQSALERSVWNGLLELNHQAPDGSDASTRDTVFAKTLLSEIGATAQKTAQAFATTLQDLHKVVMRSLLRDADGRAELAMQILDRNLYERANDCRWWALTPQFAATLSAETEGCVSATAVLQHINSLYTVYACLVLFDRQGKVLAVSRPEQSRHIGQVLDEPWVAGALRLRSSQDYTVSSYAPNRFYTEAPTFVYAAAIRDPQAPGGVLGGIGIVWDASGQMQSILADCAAGMGPRDLLAFVDASGECLHRHGASELHGAPEAAHGVVHLEGQLYGVGLARGRGYREFGTSDGYDHGLRCQTLRHLCARQAQHPAASAAVAARQTARIPTEHFSQLATFSIAGHWLGIDAKLMLKAAPDTLILGSSSARAPLVGVSQIGDTVYPVIELHGTFGDVPRPPRGVDPTRQMLVLRLPSDAGKTRECVLRVDSLGSMLDVDQRQLQVVDLPGNGHATSMVDAVMTLPGSSAAAATEKQTLLCRISQTWLWHYANGDPVPQEFNVAP